MRLVGTILAAGIVLFLAVPTHALTPSVVDPSIQLDGEKRVLISSLYTKRGEVFVELYNNTERPVQLADWTVRFTSSTSESDVILPGGWLLADSFVALSEKGIVPGVLSFPVLSLPAAEAITSVQILDGSGVIVSEVAGFPADIITKWYQRKSSGVSGTFTNDFSAATTSTKLRHTPLYQLPTNSPALRIVEIYPHASDCAPTDTSVLCGDYVKLYNPSSQSASVADYRLRSDSSTSESSNAFHLDAYDDVVSGGYLTVSLRDDGDEMSLTDDSGWLWLEDAAGVTRYEETVVSYPSASSVSKVGYAWALTADDTWQWSATPMPGLPNAFPAPGIGAGVLSDVTVCPQGKYRNPETNRCRNIEDAVAELAACAEGQARNPETNRCRSLAATAGVALVPCAVGQERNPETNRCRTSTTSNGGLTPCLAGQERNPETNRCRKTGLEVALSPGGIDPVKQDPTPNPLAMSLLGAVGVGAIGYGIYEWRSELSGALRRVASIGKK